MLHQVGKCFKFYCDGYRCGSVSLIEIQIPYCTWQSIIDFLIIVCIGRPEFEIGYRANGSILLNRPVLSPLQDLSWHKISAPFIKVNKFGS